MASVVFFDCLLMAGHFLGINLDASFALVSGGSCNLVLATNPHACPLIMFNAKVASFTKKAER